MTRFAAIGTDSFTVRCANIISEKADLVCIVSMTHENRPNNSADLASFARDRGIAYAEFDDINSVEATDWLRKFDPEILFSAWPKIMSRRCLGVPNRFVIGTHPTTLPFNRGRHPLHWMIVQGINEGHVSLFNMDEGINSGPILHQEPFSLSPDADINEAVHAMDVAAEAGLSKLLDRINTEPEFIGVVQNAENANYWRCRTPADVTLDPRLSVDMICRIVRSFTKPYPCAKLVVEDKTYAVVSATPINNHDAEATERMEHGRILQSGDRNIIVKVDGGLVNLQLEENWSQIGNSGKEIKHIYPPLYYR